MLKRINGIKREYGYPILQTIAVTDEEKGDMLAHTFIKVHSSDNIREEGKRGRKVTVAEKEEILQQNEDTNDLINVPVTKTELNRVLRKTKISLPGKD